MKASCFHYLFIHYYYLIHSLFYYYFLLLFIYSQMKVKESPKKMDKSSDADNQSMEPTAKDVLIKAVCRFIVYIDCKCLPCVTT